MSSAIDTIVDMATQTALEIRRRAAPTPVNGIFTPGAATTLHIIAHMQPAVGMARVVGGRNMTADRDGQQVEDVRVIYVLEEVFSRTPTLEPDQVFYDGSTWTIFRVQRWEDDGAVYWEALMARDTEGAS